MNKRLRLAVVGSALLGTVVVAFQQIWQRRPSVVHEHVWAGMSGNGVVNAIESGDRIDVESGRFSYYTGARAGDAGPLTAAPRHVLADADYGSVWSLRGTPEATRRPGAFSSYTETAADLYAACGELLATAALQRPAPKGSVTLVDPERGDRLFEGVLTGDELAAAMDLLRNGANGRGSVGFGPLLAATVFEEVFAGATAITPASTQGVRLLALCKDATADPFAIEPWLAAANPVATGASELRLGSD